MRTDSRITTFACPEPLCILQFREESEMIQHVVSTNHKYARTNTGMDKAVLCYAQQKHVQNLLLDTTTSGSNLNLNNVNRNYAQIFTRGWARKIRQAKRLTEKQKTFVTQLYLKGAASKIKLSAEQMADQMKDTMVDGEYYFRPEEYLDVKQIRSLISRLKKQDTETMQFSATCPDHEGILSYIDDIYDSVLDS